MLNLGDVEGKTDSFFAVRSNIFLIDSKQLLLYCMSSSIWEIIAQYAILRLRLCYQSTTICTKKSFLNNVDRNTIGVDAELPLSSQRLCQKRHQICLRLN